MSTFIKTMVVSSMVASLMLFSSFAKAGASPLTVDGATTIDTAQAKAMWLDGVAFFDPRSLSDWNQGHIPKAININRTDPAAYTRAAIESALKKDQPVVIYCNGVGCMKSARTAAELVSLGYSKVFYYREGFPEWSFAGHPVE
ncbi:MAG: adenylate cyclase [Thiomicrorhabdus sp.]|nr:MAG: adenylate cyclase [Thiomicrorhabdus sp.]